ncbi:hypothetical protein GC170_12485 [bacterium]|nr:hypothetical protein [bacterium]
MNELARKTEDPWVINLISWLTLISLFLMFRYENESLLGVVAATLFTICFSLNPNAYRNRRGSFRTVYGLMVFLWLCAAVPSVLAWI